MTRHQVTCVRKRSSLYNAHERISHIGGIDNRIRWELTEEDAIKTIEDGKYQFYVEVDKKEVDVIIAVHHQRKYLKTVPDGYSPNNLLNLPECP
ncbi:DUF3892 domain-containing protein [Chitinophaga vietnamensis]|uniref:DUF3892 domain-containing protein n=1 Tax=Chitinophaga vietnamensis TaxID=2593957 RepID=UPI001177B1A5|nr:DUF3892 domain-containing protein [Chitinophaga vietnamensis]